ncbi:MAG TPA: glycyl-radical enzyme activating protein [Polyangia bacterium]|jgi:pyruvate formate lyase activating enzyme
MRGRIFGIQRFSTEDGPGIRTTVFLKGCPMRCPWCQNPEGISPHSEVLWAHDRCLGDDGCLTACPQEALGRRGGRITVEADDCDGCGTCAAFCPSGALTLAGVERTAAELCVELGRDRAFYEESGGGITLSGGEPLSQLPFLTEVLDRAGEAGLHRAVDTCGAAGPRAFERVLGRVDLVLFDLKQMDPEKHLGHTGIALDKVLACARLVGQAGVPVWVRTPVIPGYTDESRNIRAVARFVKREMPGAVRYDLLAFSRLAAAKYEALGRDGRLLREPPLVPRRRMERLRAIALEEGLTQVTWSGMTAD